MAMQLFFSLISFLVTSQDVVAKAYFKYEREAYLGSEIRD
jgi:hypothetical protein